MEVADLDRWRALAGSLERSSRTVQLYVAELERVIAYSEDEPYERAKAGGDDDGTMHLRRLEYRSRLLLERW